MCLKSACLRYVIYDARSNQIICCLRSPPLYESLYFYFSRYFWFQHIFIVLNTHFELPLLPWDYGEINISINQYIDVGWLPRSLYHLTDHYYSIRYSAGLWHVSYDFSIGGYRCYAYLSVNFSDLPVFPRTLLYFPGLSCISQDSPVFPRTLQYLAAEIQGVNGYYWFPNVLLWSDISMSWAWIQHNFSCRAQGFEAVTVKLQRTVVLLIVGRVDKYACGQVPPVRILVQADSSCMFEIRPIKSNSCHRSSSFIRPITLYCLPFVQSHCTVFHSSNHIVLSFIRPITLYLFTLALYGKYWKIHALRFCHNETAKEVP